MTNNKHSLTGSSSQAHLKHHLFNFVYFLETIKTNFFTTKGGMDSI
uniref:Uncharacterized protein n=1 Tax=Amphimedon queenslandica TaxID=400682 RepID=A0A1X7VM37_AMPQE